MRRKTSAPAAVDRTPERTSCGPNALPRDELAHAIDCGMAGQALGAGGKAVDVRSPHTADVLKLQAIEAAF
jgi:hypothetical protein